MANYRPVEAEQMTTPLKLQIAIPKVVSGVTKFNYKDADEPNFLASFKSYGGTEKIVNDVLSIIDTAQVVCFYRPDIKANCRVINLKTNAIYRVIGDPENTDERDQFLKFKVERVKGS